MSPDPSAVADAGPGAAVGGDARPRVVDEVASAAWVGAPPAIAVVVATYGRVEFLPGLFESLEAQDLAAGEFEVVVVDNGSGDGTWDWLVENTATTPLRVSAIRIDHNAGPGLGRNAGAARIRAPLLAITDDDCLPTPRWLRHVLAAFETGADVVQGAVEPDPAAVEHMGPWDHTKRISRRTPFFETCNVAYRRADFHDAGGFDEHDPLLHPPSGRAFGEDACLAWEVIRSGGVPRFVPDAVVHHRCIPGDYARWLADQRELAGFPGLARRSPLVSRWLRHGVFLDRRSQWFALALFSVAASAVTHRRWPLVGTVPWTRRRLGAARAVAEHPLEVPGLFARLAWSDTVAFAAMARGSLRHRRLVI